MFGRLVRWLMLALLLVGCGDDGPQSEEGGDFFIVEITNQDNQSDRFIFSLDHNEVSCDTYKTAGLTDDELLCRLEVTRDGRTELTVKEIEQLEFLSGWEADAEFRRISDASSAETWYCNRIPIDVVQVLGTSLHVFHKSEMSTSRVSEIQELANSVGSRCLTPVKE